MMPPSMNLVDQGNIDWGGHVVAMGGDRLGEVRRPSTPNDRCLFDHPIILRKSYGTINILGGCCRVDLISEMNPPVGGFDILQTKNKDITV